jgi:hypothetical protein
MYDIFALVYTCSQKLASVLPYVYLNSNVPFDTNLYLSYKEK